MTKLRIHVLQHSEGTPPGSVLEWAKMHNHELTLVKLHKGEPLPALNDTDWLIILGGPMNVDDTNQHAWLAGEKALIKHAVDKKKPCLGICLGGQLLAQALGATVRKNDHWEVGWHVITLGQPTENRTAERLTAFHWHQDTFSLPEGAIRVATSKATENQAFAYGDHIVGLQFHPETTEEWVKECAEEKDYPPEGAYVQTPAQLMEGAIFITPMKKWFFGLLDRMEAISKAKAGLR